ncbi:MAG: DUF1292 domain-containing protein [Clostridia bacterium]|nr:DUF1292 domain-containing protein [Clostridia bacterium]
MKNEKNQNEKVEKKEKNTTKSEVHSDSHKPTEKDNLLDILLDETDESPIVLYNEKDEPVKFDQVAIIPIEEKLYIILKPLDEIEGVAEDEAIVFFVDEKSEDDTELVVETDEKIAMQVFDEYYKLLEKSDA